MSKNTKRFFYVIYPDSNGLYIEVTIIVVLLFAIVLSCITVLEYNVKFNTK